ncbi:Protein YIPF5-like protein [Psilocybe cubensis]|uniref:Protein YIP n=2 Tax=Psilocybe cubensis TaxID=181762 RepID=A0A8H8CND9_PSICU|nr:Protein YIPF5-like protein [Psilocybe cubensis]KAH9485426.1 Protein YIPF5-like protein [Psilocybe cubensis]
MWQQDNANLYASSSNYYPQQLQQEPLQFYSQPQEYYVASRTSLDGQVQGSIAQQPSGFGGNMQPQGGWWTAFGTGGFEGEPPLLEAELGINFQHIRDKSLTVLNPLRRVDEHIMDDADLAGPIFFCFCFGICLLFSGKSNFNYIYGVGLFGSASLYTLLNLMSEQGIDAYRVASVLGYCLLPMVGVGAISVTMALDDTFGYLLSVLSILWCTYAASGIFVAVLRLSDQRLLVAYPVGLLYGCFALLSIFNGRPLEK